MNTTASNVEVLQQQTANVQEQLFSFDQKAFLLNLAIVSLVIWCAVLLHKKALLRRALVVLRRPGSGEVWRPSSVTEFWLGLLKLIQTCVSSRRQDAVRLLGFEFVNLISFEAKLCFLFMGLGVGSLLLAFFYMSLREGKIHLTSFMMGQMDVWEDLPLLSIFSTLLALGVFWVCGSLARDAQLSNEFLVESEVRGRRRYQITSRVVLFDRLSAKIDHATLAKDLGIPESRIVVLNIPKMAKLAQIQEEIDKFHEGSFFWKHDKSALRLFYRLDARTESIVSQRGGELLAKLRELLGRQPKFCGRSLVFFSRFDDILTFRQKFPSLERSSFIIGHRELITRNLDITDRERWLRFLFHGVLILILLFISTPMKVISAFMEFIVTQQFASSIFEDILQNDISKFVFILIFPLFIILISFLLTQIIMLLSVMMKFSRHTHYQRQTLFIGYIYLLINYFLVPGFSILPGISVYEASSRMTTTSRFLKRLIIYESGSFFPTLILQTATVSFLSNYLLVSPLVARMFSYESVFRHYETIHNQPYRVHEKSVFRFGNAYAADAVIATIAAVFGVYQPLIFFATAIYFGLGLFSNAAAIASLYKDQLFSKNKLLVDSLRRIRLATVLGTLLVAFKCFIAGWLVLGLLDFAIAAALLFLALCRPINSLSFADFAKLRKEKLNAWGIDDESQALLFRENKTAEEKNLFLEKYRDATILNKMNDKTPFV